MKDFKNRVAVVTGAASGMGKAFCMDFARRGMKVVLADMDADRLNKAEKDVQELGAETLTLRTDVSDAAAVTALADAAFDRFGAVNVVCNNAGVVIDGPAHEATHAQWEWLIGVNLWGVIHGIQAFLPRMLEGGQEGHIVNTSSMAGMIAFPNSGVYNATKYAVVGLTESLWQDLQGSPIGASVLCPMWVRTAIFRSGEKKPASVRSAHPEIDMSSIKDENWLTPEEVSPMVLDAIEKERLHIFTHSITEEFMERRFRRVQDAYLR